MKQLSSRQWWINILTDAWKGHGGIELTDNDCKELVGLLKDRRVRK